MSQPQPPLDLLLALPEAPERLLQVAQPASFPSLESDSPEDATLEDTLLAAAALSRRQADLDQLPPHPLPPVHTLRLGQEITPSAEVVPVVALAWYRGEAVSAEALAFDPVLQEAARRGQSPSQLARLALASPARVLARHPEALLFLPRYTAFAERLRCLAVRRWFQVARSGAAQRLIEETTALPLPSDRVGALTGLLRMARRTPSLRIEAVRVLIAALDALEAPPDHGARLEAAALRLGSWVAAELGAPGGALGVGIGRHLTHTLLASPFLGADAELLAARLTALETRHKLESGSPFSLEEGLRPGALPLLSAVLEEPRLSPEVLQSLKRLAQRTCSAGERLVSTSPDVWAPEWSEDVPLPPPQIARFLLQRHGARWLSALPKAAREEWVRFMEIAEPAAARWAMPALQRELAVLDESTRTRLKGRWLSLREKASPAASWFGPWLLWGIGHLPELTDEEALALAAAAARAPESWRVGLLALIAQSASSQAARASTWCSLLSLIEHGEPALRPPAAVALLLLVRRGHAGRELLDQIEQLLTPDLLQHPDVREEWRRVGHSR